MPIPAGSTPPAPPTSGPLIYDPVLSRVRITVDGIASQVLAVRVERSVDQVVWSTVRGGSVVSVVAGEARLDDYEFAADTLNYYRISVATSRNANPYFETDASSWTQLGSTIARSTTQAHQGVASLLLTPDGVTGAAQARAELVPVVGNASYPVQAWVRCAVARPVRLSVDWHDSLGSLLSVSDVNLSVAANTWSLIESSLTAPASAVQARLLLQLTSSPPVGHTTFIDEALIIGPTGEVLFSGSIVPVLGGVWLKSVARPFLNRQVVVRDFSDVSRRARAGVFDVVGRSYPVAVTDVRGSRQWTLDLSTYSEQARSELDLLLASGDILLVHVPSDSGRISATPGGYVTVGDTREATPPTSDLAMRVFSLPCVEVASPGPDVVGATSNWQTVLNSYSTWADLLAAHPTWESVLELVGDPEDVIVS